MRGPHTAQSHGSVPRLSPTAQCHGSVPRLPGAAWLHPAGSCPPSAVHTDAAVGADAAVHTDAAISAAVCCVYGGASALWVVCHVPPSRQQLAGQRLMPRVVGGHRQFCPQMFSSISAPVASSANFDGVLPKRQELEQLVFSPLL